MGVIRLLNVRHLRRQPLRAVLTGLAVAAGTSLALAVVVVTNSINATLRDFGRQVAGVAPLRVEGALNRASLDERVLDRVAHTPGVAAAVPVVQTVTIAKPNGGPGHGTYVAALGVDCRIQALVGSFGCSDQAPAATSVATAPVLSPKLARLLGPHGVVRTDAAPVPVGGAVTVPALDRVNGGRVVVFPLVAAQRLFDRPGRLDAVYVVPRTGTDVRTLERRLAAAVGPWNRVRRAAQGSYGLALFGPILPMLGLTSLIALTVAGGLIFNTTVMALEERRRELAVAGAVGATGRTIALGLLAETGVVGAAGGLVGVVGAALIARGVAANISSLALERDSGLHVTVHLSAVIVALGAGLGLLVSALCTAIPARRATRLDLAAEVHGRADRAPVTRRRASTRSAVASVVAIVGGIGLARLAARHDATQSWQPPVGVVALILTAGSFFVLAESLAPAIFHVLRHVLVWRRAPVQVGLAGLARDKARTRVIGGAVGAAVGMGVALGSAIPMVHDTVGASVGKLPRGSVTVTNLPVNNTVDVDARLGPEVLARLAGLPGVAGANHYIFPGLVLVGHPFAISAFEPQLPAYRTIAGSSNTSTLGPDEAMVGPGLARDYHLHVGSTLRIPGPTGFVTVRVRGIWENPDFNGHAATLPFPLVTSTWGPRQPGWVFLRPAAGITAAELARRVQAAHLDPDLQALTPEAFIGSISRDVTDQMKPFWTMQRSFLVMALVVTMSTLLLVGVQRRRELGLLGAAGFSPGGLGALTLVEAALVGAVASAIGTLGGAAVTEAFRQAFVTIVAVRAPFRLNPVLPFVYGALATAVVVAGASLPAWRAARLPVVEALRYE